MNISRFQKTLPFRVMFSFLLTAGMVGLQNAEAQGSPTSGDSYSSTIQMGE